MNIYLYELKANRKFAITWIITMICIVFFLALFFPSFANDVDDFAKIMSNLPASIQSALGMNPKTIGTILGYYAFVLTILTICGAMEAMLLGLSILSKEIRAKTADFLLSKPVSRNQIVASKLLACLTIIVVSNLIYLLTFYPILLMYTNASFPYETYALLTLTVFFIQIMFFTIGALISVIVSKVKAILPLSLGIVFGIYLLSTFSDEKLRALLPFKYFNIPEILQKSSYEFKYVWLALGIAAISVILTFVIYKKKDIQAV